MLIREAVGTFHGELDYKKDPGFGQKGVELEDKVGQLDYLYVWENAHAPGLT